MGAGVEGGAVVMGTSVGFLVGGIDRRQLVSNALLLAVLPVPIIKHVQVCVYVNLYVYMHIYILMGMHIYIYMRVYIYTHVASVA